MRFVFDPDQEHQRRALAAVRAAFGRALDCGSTGGPAPIHVDGIAAQGNPRPASLDELDAAARVVQTRDGLPTTGWDRIRSDGADHGGVPALSVEMETGTGKTYVFLRTALELARHHGLRKFLVVVPSVAIREGVRKTLQVTREHFGALYPDVPYRFSVYDGGRPHLLDRFVRGGNVELMIITIDAFNKETNVLRQQSDRFGGRAPMTLLQATAPVLLLDEPHHLHSPLRIQALCDLQPSLALRFGATYRSHAGLVHRLSPAQAHRAGLVKTIEVVGDLPPGDDDAAVSARIRATVENHLRRQAELQSRGIKVLSLFFVDRVAGYAHDDGRVRRMFDAHYRELASLFPGAPTHEPEQVRAAYFAQGKGRFVDSHSGKTAADREAYRLIMRDKERLLDLHEPVSFVFTHSALREGWDNPNVFQICTISATHSQIKKRQEIGRGIRLCVDQDGHRVADPEVNVLRVFAHQSYDDYVRALQDELPSTLQQHERPPVPRRVQAGSRPRSDAGDQAAEGQQPMNLGTLLSEAPAALAASLQNAAGGPGSMTLIDDISLALQRRRPPLPLRRATILRILVKAADRGAKLGDSAAVIRAFEAAVDASR